MGKSKLLILPFKNIILKIDWSFERWVIFPHLSYIQTNNYNWELFQPEAKYFIPGYDK